MTTHLFLVFYFSNHSHTEDIVILLLHVCYFSNAAPAGGINWRSAKSVEISPPSHLSARSKGKSQFCVHISRIRNEFLEIT